MSGKKRLFSKLQNSSSVKKVFEELSKRYSKRNGGYSRVLNKNKNINIKLLTKAFQRRFRQSLINGIIDQECLLISKNIAKKLK